MTQKAGWLKDLSTAIDSEAHEGSTLDRIARALEIMAGTAEPLMPDWAASAYCWDGNHKTLRPAPSFKALPLDTLIGIERQAEILKKNTQAFADGFSANNALLWGSRGTGKSSLVKSVFQKICKAAPSLHLIEIHKEDLSDLPLLVSRLGLITGKRFILFIDDLSFESSDDRYKSLKSALEGSVDTHSANIVVYATSNRRHLLPRRFEENENTHLHPAEAAEENISLSDRFGLWLGFYPCDQATYLRMVETYARNFNLNQKDVIIEKLALEWAATRGTRSGRVAWQFIKHLAGQSMRQIDQ